MKYHLLPWLGIGRVSALAAAQSSKSAIFIPQNCGPNCHAALLPSYVSLSIELATFPEYAGTTSQPNTYSVNLLNNIAKLQGTMPVIRVGGNSQDQAIYDASLTTATAHGCKADPHAVLCIGKSFFNSYGTFPGARYSHGFNLAWNNATGYNSLAATVPLACKAIGAQNLETWEYGNEPDLYINRWRKANWAPAQYVDEWHRGVSRVYKGLQKACPDFKTSNFMAPSVASTGSKLGIAAIFNGGLNSGHKLDRISVHNYITRASSPGITLQNTLLNHASTVESLGRHVATAKDLSGISNVANVPYILGECNSLSGGGRRGISNVFGSALWVLDFVSHGASTGVIKRMHFHQAFKSPYSAWTPTGSGASTHPSYYGKLAAARFLGNSAGVSVSEIALPGSTSYQSAYAAYDINTKSLKRLAVINMREYTSTQGKRPKQTYTFKVAASSRWTVERLQAGGAEKTSGVTFNGFAYEHATGGLPQQVNAKVEKITAGRDGILRLSLPDSEAAILSIN